MKLSTNQIEIIRAQIARSIQIQSLQDDVLDHVCCSLEEQEDLECEFEEAVQCAVNVLAPAGLHELQRHTLLLLNTKYIVMKKFMYLLGLLSAIASSMGVCFKLLHLPGADFLLTYGFLALTLLYLPMQAIVWSDSYAKSSVLKKLEVLFTLLSGLFTGSAIVLRLFHISGTPVELIFIGGAVLFSFGFLPVLFFSLYKRAVA